MWADHRRIAAGALVTLSVALAACGSDDAEPTTTTVETAPATTSTTQSVTPASDPAEVHAAPTAEPPAPKPRLTLKTPSDAYPVIWVRSHQTVEMRTQPGGGELVKEIGRESPFGSPTVFGVVAKRGPWAGVTTALLPNGQLGWIKLNPSRIESGWTRYSITVDLSARRAALARGDHVVFSFPITIGAPGTDTPMGRFAVTDTFTGLDSAAYGCCALALSATQPDVPSGWLGGRTIAIHGTSGPLGIAASHGCVRAADADVAGLVRKVPLGTPVFIRA